MKYMANLNNNHMISFLMLTIGSLILGTEDRSNISNHYYITDRAFDIKQGGIINVEYGVKQNDSYLSGGLNPVTVEFRGGTTQDVIQYGFLPQISNLANRSFSAWIYVDAFDAIDFRTIFHNAGAFISTRLYLNNTKLVFDVAFSTSKGVWIQTNANTFSIGQWVNVVVTYNRTSVSNDPIIYVNSVSQAITESITPVGATPDEIGAKWCVGNSPNATGVFIAAFDGKIFDNRVYNRILTAAEVTTLYNAGVPDETLVTNGIVFQGPAVYADQGDATSLAGTVLSSSSRLVENALRAVGIPAGAPVIRANP